MEKNREKVLEVNNLRVSFKTNTGTVKAVRGISFNLYKGRTLAIVGESGSGKSVTSKAILGILANNKIIEDGQIIFDGKDLLRISEDTFTNIRGVKISMIFQDPLSSLNPIMKVGKQLTEAMYLKSKASKREAKTLIKKYHAALKVTAGKELFLKLNEVVSAINSLSQIDELNEFDELFKNTIDKAISAHKDNAYKAYELVQDLKSKYFIDINSFNVEQVENDLKNITTALKAAVYTLESEPDDIIEVFSVSMKEFLKSYKENEKRNQAREALLIEHGVTDIYSLPPSIRAKEREVILPQAKIFESMAETVSELCDHLLNDIYNNIKLSSEYLLEGFKKSYFDSIIQSKTEMSQAEAKEKAITLMKEVGINDPERRYNQYPFEFSGGMRQRIVIAIALSSNPEVLICDEPTTALDVTIQAQILELINKLKVEKNLSIIFITHDLGVVANMADDIAVMYAGKIVETGSVYDVFYDPRHPYTWALLGSMPDLDTKEKLDAIPGTPPNMLLPPKGDAFAPRNKYALKMDYEEFPPFFAVSPTHSAATWLLDEDAPDVVAPKTVVDRIFNSLNRNPQNKPEFFLAKNSIIKDFLEGK